MKSRSEERSTDIKRKFIRSMMNEHENYKDADRKPVGPIKFNRGKLARLKYKVFLYALSALNTYTSKNTIITQY